MIQRYDIVLRPDRSDLMAKSEHGEYVEYEDYAALERELVTMSSNHAGDMEKAERELVQEKARSGRLRDALDKYACPADCSIARMKDGTCLAANMGDACGETARKALKESTP